MQFRSAVGMRRRQLIAAAAISLAIAIWSMHFVGMLAVRLPFAVDYLVFPTLLSFLVCVIVVGVAVFAVGTGPLRAGRLLAAAGFMGAGIASMHYSGMSALYACARIDHDPWFVIGSVVVGVAASGLALWLANGRATSSRAVRPPLLLSAAALGGAITGMHYTAMAGLTIVPYAAPLKGAPALSTDLLAIVVSVVAFVVSGFFLLALVPDRRSTPALAAPAQAPPLPGTVHVVEPPVGVPAPAVEALPGSLRSNGLAHQLPVEHEGATRHLAVDGIVAIRANAHYTYLYDGRAEHFCPLAIGEVEARLDPERFVRVHRSHIVKIDHILRLKRAGDNGIVELDGPGRPTVPVSRGRLSAVRSRIGLRVA